MNNLRRWQQRIQRELSQEGLSVRLELRPNWGSSSSQNRLKIRRWVKKSGFASIEILDLRKRPLMKTGRGSISISHCESLGGVAMTPEFTVGLDLEITRLIRPAVAQKVSSSDESYPPAFIWTIKEATFKVLSDEIQTISQVQIRSVKKSGRNRWRFETEMAFGFLFQFQDWTLAIAIRRDSHKSVSATKS